MNARAILLIGALSMTACNENTALGNDRAAQLQPAPTPAPVVPAKAALANVAPAIIKPETMSLADIEALGGRAGRCAMTLTEVAFPSFLFEPGVTGAIKLNGKLIPLPEVRKGLYQSGGLTVSISLLDEESNAGSQGMQMIVVPPGADDELGYHGYVQCYEEVEV